MDYSEMTAKELKTLADEKNFSYAKNASQAKMVELHENFDNLKALKEKNETLEEGIEDLEEAGLDATKAKELDAKMDEVIDEMEEELGITEETTVTTEEVAEVLEDIEAKLGHNEKKPQGVFKGKCPLTGKDIFA